MQAMRTERLTPIEHSLLLTLAFRGRQWVGHYKGLVTSFDSLALSIGRQRPGACKAPPEAKASNAQLRRAADSLEARGLIDRSDLRRVNLGSETMPKPQYAPYRWWVLVPESIGRASKPAWNEAPKQLERLARQISTIGPAAEMALVRLSLAADEHGEVVMTRAQLSALVGLSRDTLMTHLENLAEAGFGIASLKPAAGKVPLWIIKLQLVPVGERLGRARERHCEGVWERFQAAQAADAPRRAAERVASEQRMAERELEDRARAELDPDYMEAMMLTGLYSPEEVAEWEASSPTA